MKLFSKEIDKKLFKQYPKGEDLSSQVAVSKIFNPYGVGRWYLINSDPNDPDYIWAIVQMGNVVEVGSVSRKQLETLRIKPFNLPLERDLSFGGVNASELFKGLSAGKFYKAGGFTEGSENKDMLLNQAEGFEHHAEELESAVKKADYVPAWVVAKSQRASTDLSDITHYLDGENEQREEEMEGEEEYGNGGIIGGLTADESIYLYIKKAIVQKYREKYLKPAGLLGTPKGKYVEQSLIKKGFLNNAGAITEVGKNKAREVDSEIGLMISRGYISSTNLPSKYKEIVEKFESDDKMADGGMMAKGGVLYLDLFENQDEMPFKLKAILDKYEDEYGEDISYQALLDMQKDVEEVGYTFDFGLDSSPYGLRPMGVEISQLEGYDGYGEDEMAMGGMMAKGGRLDVGRYYKTKDGKQVRYLGGTNDPEVGTFMNRADGVFKLRYDEIGGKASAFASGGMMAKGGELGGFKKGDKVVLKYDINNRHGAEEVLVVVGFDDQKLVLNSPSKKIGKSKNVQMLSYVYPDDVVSYDNFVGGMMAKGGKIEMDVVVKTPKGIVTKKDFEGFTKKEIIEWCEERGWVYNPKGEKLGGRILKEYEFFIKSPTKYNVTLPKKSDGGMMSKIERMRLVKDRIQSKSKNKMAMGGKVKFADKVKSIKASLLERKKVSPKVQKDYGKTYSPKEAEESAKRIVGAMTAKERLMAKKKKK